VPSQREIRADHDRTSLVVYQAYSDAIADVALERQRFGPPFSLNRMTWIKPSFLWLMERSNWGLKSGQERILAVRIKREGWEAALALGVLTSFEPAAHGTPQEWGRLFEAAAVHIQWDPERSLRGQALPHDSIQVGLGRTVIGRYVDEWCLSIEDLTERVRKIRKFLDAGRADQATRLLPRESVYPLPASLRCRLGM
jgi:hypothetical protein